MIPALLDLAACRAYGTESWWKLDTDEQIHVCQGCPVRNECLQEALEQNFDERFNVWGGVNFYGVRTTVFRCHCLNCGDDFHSKSPATTCSATCRQAYARKPSTERVAAQRRYPAPQKIHRDTCLRIPGNCSECGKHFVAPRRGVHTCSEECQYERKLRVKLESQREWQRHYRKTQVTS